MDEDESLITTYQEVCKPRRSDTCCDDENEWVSGDIDLPEQRFFKS